VKDQTGSWDGWYWADLAAPTKPQKPTRKCAEPQISFVGFGLYCMNCHASALGQQGTYATSEHVNVPPTMLTDDEPEILDNIHQRFPDLFDPPPIQATLAPSDQRIPCFIVPRLRPVPLSPSPC